MLVLPLDSLRRFECQPTPPMLWLRSDSRLVWHLLGGGCFLSLGGLGGGGGSTGDGRGPRGTAVLRGEQRGRASSLLFGSHAERGCGPGGLRGRGVAGCTPPKTPQPGPEGRSSRRRSSSSSCLGSSAPSAPRLELAVPFAAGLGAQPGSLLPDSEFFPLGREPLSVWGLERGGSNPHRPRGTTRLRAIPGRSLCFPARPSLQGTPPTAASSGSTRGAATAARSAPSPPPPERT